MFTIFCLAFLFGVTVNLYLWYRRNFRYWTRHKTVASVPGRIFSGKFTDFLTFKTNFGYHLRTIYDDPKFANEAVVGVYGIYKPSLLIRDPELIKSILIRDFHCFCNRFAKPDPHYDRCGAQTMFFARYKVWKDIRSKLSPIFSGAKLKNMYQLLQNVGDNLENYLRKQGQGYRTELKDFSGRYTTDVIATTLFGFSSNCLENPREQIRIETQKLGIFNLRRSLAIMVIFFLPKLTSIFRPHFFDTTSSRFLKHSVEQMMAERERTATKRNDLIDIFVKLKQEAQANGEDVPKFVDFLAAQATVFQAAGYETSSTTMANVLLELAKQPSLQKRLRDEIHQTFVKGGGEVTYEALGEMSYLDMVVHETLRLYPVLPIIERECGHNSGKPKPYSLKPYCDFVIPDGMPVYISAYGLHYDPKYWPNPTRFDPERFSAENRKTLNPMTFLGFGRGPHNCVGSRLGLLEVKCGLLHTLKNHYVRICDETVIQPKFEAKAFILQVSGGIVLDIVRDDMCVMGGQGG